MINIIEKVFIPLLCVVLMCSSTSAYSALVYSDTNATGDFWARPVGSGPSISPIGPVQYHVQSFYTAGSGNFNFESTQDYDGYLHLYEFVFSPTAQLANILAANDDGGSGVGSSNFSFNLVGSRQYYLVTSAFAAGDVGNFTNSIGSDDVDIAVYAGSLRIPEPAMLAIFSFALIGLASCRFKRSLT